MYAAKQSVQLEAGRSRYTPCPLFSDVHIFRSFCPDLPLMNILKQLHLETLRSCKVTQSGTGIATNMWNGISSQPSDVNCLLLEEVAGLGGLQTVFFYSMEQIFGLILFTKPLVDKHSYSNIRHSYSILIAIIKKVSSSTQAPCMTYNPIHDNDNSEKACWHK